mgnify:FL=1
MSILQDGFNADEVAPSTGFDAIPPGKYKAVISESEEKQTKKGDGSYLQLTFTVIDGEYENRKLWARLNLNNPNDQAVSIARAELSAICRSVGVRQIKDPSQLHDIPLLIRVNAKADDKGELRNEIKGYEAANVATTTTKQPATAAAGGKAPWAKK